jgi:hypothetical protein
VIVSEFNFGVHQVRPEDLTEDVVDLVVAKSGQPIDVKAYKKDHIDDLAIFVAEDTDSGEPLGIIAVAPDAQADDVLEVTAHAVSRELNGSTAEVNAALLERCMGLAELVGRETVEIDTRYVGKVEPVYTEAGFAPLSSQPEILVKAS